MHYITYRVYRETTKTMVRKLYKNRFLKKALKKSRRIKQYKVTEPEEDQDERWNDNIKDILSKH